MSFEILEGDSLAVLRDLPDESVRCCVTSPPYWRLRDYSADGQLGLEATPEEFVGRLVEVFREVRRVLSTDGTLWLNLGDSYAGSYGAQGQRGDMAERGVISARSAAASPRFESGAGTCPPGLKPKDLVGIPWRVAFALQEDGWWLRQDIIWHKPNPMPESVADRCTKAHEYIFLMSKSARYFYDSGAIREKDKGAEHPRTNLSRPEPSGGVLPPHTGLRISKGRAGLGCNKRSVWSLTTRPFKGAHFATFPPELPALCIKAGTEEGDTVLDPFSGAGTTGLVALRLNRSYVGIELNPEYAEMSRRRIRDDAPLLNLDSSRHRR